MESSKIKQTNGFRLTGASLRNIGSTCFVNSVLQCLTHTVPLVEAFRSSDHYSFCSSDDDETFCCLCAMNQHVNNCLRASGFTITPRRFVENLGKISTDFLLGHQQDAHEFLSRLLDKLHDCYSGKPSSYEVNTPIKQIFCGRIRSQVVCCACGHSANSYEPFIDLSLEINDAEICTVTDALDSYTRVEKIDDPENKFPCEGCKINVSVEKQIKLVEAPPVLMLNFKRFKVDIDGMYKISKLVKYPLQLDLSPYLLSADSGNIYELYAILVHYGRPDDGHYYTIVHSAQNVWHVINDDKVVRLPEDLIFNRAAYILFYIRQGSSPCFADLLERIYPLHSISPRTSVETLEKKNDLSVVEAVPLQSDKNVDEYKSQSSEDHSMRLNEGTEEDSSTKIEGNTQNGEGSTVSKKRGRLQCDDDDAILPQSPL